MKSYDPLELRAEKPELFKTIMAAFREYLPKISKEVIQVLKASRMDVAFHSTYCRIIDDNTEEVYYTEIRTMFKLLDHNGLSQDLIKIHFHEAEDYEKAKQDTLDSNKKYVLKFNDN